MNRKQLNLNLLVFVVVVLFTPGFSFAQSAILTTPNLPDIFATLESGSDFLAIIGILFATIFLLSKTAVDIISFLPFLFVKRSKKYWGVAYNTITREPIDNIVVNLYRLNNNNYFLINKCKTDSSGKYGFRVGKGEYKINVTNNKYIFPSRYIVAENKAEKENFYQGKKFFITGEDNHPAIDLPLDPAFSASFSFGSKLYYYGKRIGLPLMLLGTFFALYSLYYFPNKFRLILISFYSTAWFLIALDLFKKTRGIKIVSNENGIPIEQAIVDFYDSSKIKIYSSSTDETGRIFPKIPPGEYLVKIHRPYKNSKQTKVSFKSKSSFGQIVIKI